MNDEIQIDASFMSGRHDTYRELRNKGTVHRVRQPNGLQGWLVTGYEACRSMLADPRLLKNIDGISDCIERQTGTPMAPQMRHTSTHMLNADPPEHSRLRRLIGDAFKPTSVAVLRPKVERIATELLDEMASADATDLISAYAVPLPLRMICELLGIPFADRQMFLSWLVQMHSMSSLPEDRARGTSALWGYLMELIHTKRKCPGDDKLSELATADCADALSESELVSMAHLLLVAGHEAISGMLGNALLIALQRANIRSLLVSGDATVAGLIEELLRFDGAIEMSTTRYTAEPVEIDGVVIPAHSFVWMALGGANRDPAQFDNADELRLRPHTEPHLAFGHGVHYCVGANLARLEADVALRAFVGRYPLAELVGDEPMSYQGGGLLPSRLTDLHVRLHSS